MTGRRRVRRAAARHVLGARPRPSLDPRPASRRAGARCLPLGRCRWGRSRRPRRKRRWRMTPRGGRSSRPGRARARRRRFRPAGPLHRLASRRRPRDPRPACRRICRPRRGLPGAQPGGLSVAGARPPGRPRPARAVCARLRLSPARRTRAIRARPRPVRTWAAWAVCARLHLRPRRGRTSAVCAGVRRVHRGLMTWERRARRRAA
jgi:hypothetical protein